MVRAVRKLREDFAKPLRIEESRAVAALTIKSPPDLLRRGYNRDRHYPCHHRQRVLDASPRSRKSLRTSRAPKPGSQEQVTSPRQYEPNKALGCPSVSKIWTMWPAHGLAWSAGRRKVRICRDPSTGITHRSPAPYGRGPGAAGPISYWPARPIFAFRAFSSNYKRHKRQRVTCGANGFPD
jgi:hypothetical protein